ncbi:MarR family transcriptional regulator [Pseudoclavibacter chungangensis]|uniref:MarR family transcriptional regulator n=1 Tax=Pseudoclavibacter chungangensis TaxID=587635 RepID=A0A7J5BYM8_9MICO|nr:MarR family transcriptional regulator [Pseudoclavibacter chungangensis]KAB1659466.1 MarR family transcriptional regulator [Pseudoclavibacter chungangensis]NYJ67678.1 hypothetical protein [Pseudoclavibacter chungangensis]
MADERPIGFWLKLVDGLIEDRFAEVIEEHGVTRRQWQLMSVLVHGPATVEVLDERIAPFLRDAGAEVREDGLVGSAAHLAELVESGWVVGGAGEPYALTERGVGAAENLAKRVTELQNGLADGVAQAEYDATIATLAHFARNLGWDG